MPTYLGKHFTETVILSGIENIHIHSDIGDVSDITDMAFDDLAEATGLTIDFKAHKDNFNVQKHPRVGRITKTSLVKGCRCIFCPLSCTNQAEQKKHD